MDEERGAACLDVVVKDGRIAGEGAEVVLMTPVPRWTWRNRRYSHVPGSNVSAVSRPSKPVVRSALRS